MINSQVLWQSGLFTPKAHPNGLCKNEASAIYNYTTPHRELQEIGNILIFSAP